MLMKNWRLLAAGAVAGIILIVAIVGHGKNTPISSISKCGPYRVDKTVKVGSQQIKAEVAITPQEQSKGLGGRPCITASQGMLFVFNKPSYYSIWMKNMHFPIDIVWVGADHKTVGFERNISPSTYPDRFSNKDKPAKYVLELRASRTKTLGIELGTPINF
jgi:uncharacterized membrane protein (UPF0127 family)